jgi:hypothetical protein
VGQNNKSKNKKAIAVSQLIAGLKKHFPNEAQSATLGGVSTTIGAVTNELQAYVTSRANVVMAQAAATAKVATENTQLPAVNALVHEVTAFVLVNFGKQADVLADFGVKAPRAKTPMTAQAKAVAAAKRNATREARGTKGTKAKKAVHGDITAELVVTPAGTATPTATPAPVTAPAAGTTGTPSRS